jgi:hypothetical protein
MLEFVRDIWGFLKERRKWWLFPVIFSLILIGIIIAAGANSALAPFVYTFF